MNILRNKGVIKVGQQEICCFFDSHRDVAFSSNVLKKQYLPHENKIFNKLKQLAKTGLIHFRRAKIDYQNKRNVATTYYYVGEPRMFVPEPKDLI